MDEQGVVTSRAGRGTSPKAGTARDGGPDPHRLGRLSSSVLVGRERDLELLLEAIMNPLGLILVEGEAGVGKTRLVQEALSDPLVQSGRVLVGHCHRLREPFPLGPVVEALRGTDPPNTPLSPVVGVLQPLLPELAHALPPEPPPTGDPRAERHRIFRALRELIGALGPTVCLLEDMHWADEGTLEFLAFLLAEPSEGLSIILTYRKEDLHPSSSLFGLASRLPRDASRLTLELAPLSVDEVRALTCALLDASSVSGELAEGLYDRSAGLPFALEEVIRLLLDRGQLTLTEDGEAVGDLQPVGVPTVIGHSIRERMEPFSADARLITHAAAVLGLPADEALLARVAGLPPKRAARGLTRALSSALMEEREDGFYGLRHALAGQAVYDEIPAPERRRLHQRAGEALAESATEPAPPAQLAHHFQHADRPKQWAHYAEAAADGALAVGDARTATRFLEQSLSAPGLSRAARIRLAVKLGSCAAHSDFPQKAIGLLQRILEEEPMNVGVRGELRFRLSQLRYCVGDGGLWHEDMVRAAGELRRRPELAARVMVQLAWPMLREGDVADDLAWLERASAAAEAADDPVTKAGISSQRAAILLCVGDPAGWTALEDVPEEASSVEERLQLLRSYQSLSVVARGLGYYQRSESFLAEVTRLERELEHVWWDPWRESAQVALDWCLGRWDGLDQRLRKLAGSGTGTATLAVGSELILGSLLLSRGQIEESEGIFSSVLNEAQRRGWLGARVAASAGLARLRLAEGDPQGAGRAAALGLDVVRHKGIWIWGKEVIPVAVEASLACEKWAEAGHLAAQFATGVDGRDAPAAHAASSFCQAIMARATDSPDAAARLFHAAERGWNELPCPYEAARAREERARCLLAGGQEDGVDVLRDALDGFEGLQASWDATRIRATLRAQGIPSPPASRGGRKAYGDELSPREAEVARLAGTGRKNREIAETLFISPRTVEAHVASAIRKLGLESRQELATLAEDWTGARDS